MSPPLVHVYIGQSETSAFDGGGRPPELNLKQTELRLGPPGSESPDRVASTRTGVAGAKRGFSDAIDGKGIVAAAVKDADVAAAKAMAGQDKKAQKSVAGADHGVVPVAKAQVVGWPPIRSYRKNTMATNPVKNKEEAESKQGPGCLYVKVSMDGAPYLRKVDLKTYDGYKKLSVALEKMFTGFTMGQCGSQRMPGRDGLSESRLVDLLNGSEYVLTYEDNVGDWMLVGDVPWEMFIDSCRRMRIMKGSDAIGLAPRAKENGKNWN